MILGRLKAIWASTLNSGLDPEQVSPDVLRRIRTINLVVIVSIAVGLAAVARHVVQDLPFFAVSLVITIAINIANLVLMRYRPNPTMGGHIAVSSYMLVQVLHNSATGGFYDPNMGFLYVTPILAALLVDRRALWLYTVATILTVYGFFYFEHFLGGLPNIFPPEEHAGESLFNRITTTFLLAVACSAFLADREPMLKSITRLAGAAKAFGEGRYDEPVHVRGEREIEVLSRVMDEARQKIMAQLEAQTKHEEELVRLLVQAEAATEAKSQFLATMSHELRTPMNAILGYTEMLAEDFEDNPEVLSDLNRILYSGQHLMLLINQILQLSHLESSTTHLELQQFEVHEVLQDLVEEAKVLVEANHNTITVRGAVGTVLNADLGKFKQCLRPLIQNACKFTRNGTITVTVENIEERMLFHVSDTGTGIPKDKVDTIFEPFTQVDGTTTRQFDGTGLGLAVSLRFANLMQGTIEVESEYGKGSVFTLVLPQTVLAGRVVDDEQVASS